MDSLAKGWFSELSDEMWPGECRNLKVKENGLLYHKKSDFQDVMVFDSETYGRVLVLDGVIQCTERDEFAYQEMITHLPLASLDFEPKKVLIIGGGDGGCVREALKHSSVEEVHLCDIDGDVIKVSKELLPYMSSSFTNPKVHVHVMDGAVFLKQHKNNFDVIIVDSSDPVGPASTLFGREFFQSCYEALTERGLLCTQAESVWLHLDLIAKMREFIGEIFPKVSYAYTSIPTYPSGVIGFFCCSKQADCGFEPKRQVSNQDELRYYTPEIHKASFVLPAFAAKKLKL
ncbi:hypothetical protein ABK040_010077 [Willaertia magna]